MKKLLIVLILLLSSNVSFAFTIVPKVPGEKAKVYLQPGQHLHDVMIDATGFTHGIEMNVPGTAYLTNVTVHNANTQDNRGLGNGRGIVAYGSGVHIIVNGALSHDNSEDGYRAINGAKMTIINSVATENRVIGYFVGAGSSMELINSNAAASEHGIMGVEEFVDISIDGGTFNNNSHQGMQFWEGDNLDISNVEVTDNGTDAHEYAGIAIYGVKSAVIKDSSVKNNKKIGIASAADTDKLILPSGKNYAPTRLLMERVEVIGSPIAVISQGDSIVTIADSPLEGSCIEEGDGATTPIFGIITVDGKAVEDDGVCP